MINFLPPEYSRRNIIEENLPLIISLVLIAIILVSSLGFYIIKVELEINNYQAKTELVEAKLAEVNNKVNSLKMLRKKKEALLQQINSQGEFSQQSVVRVFRELNQIIAEESWALEFDIREKKNFQLLGYTLDLRDFQFIVRSFKDSECFNNINIIGIQEKLIEVDEYHPEEGIYYQLNGQISFIEGD